MRLNRTSVLKRLLQVIPVFVIPALVFGSLIQTLSPRDAYADLASEWQAGNIISDAVMTNKGTMSVSAIQSFLNSKVPNCDTNGTQLSEFGGPDLNGDGKVQRWEWGKNKYNQIKFPCLKDYTLGGKSAAQIIYDKAHAYSINPQVLIVLLQKEQSLVTDTWPLNIQYKTATGYGCPDTAPCDSQYFGLSNQLDWAAKMFRAIMDNSPTWYTPYEVGNNYIQYNPSSSCGGSTVNIQNRATQSLYNYTPYQPNKAALQAGWGSASCGAYGNRNFYLYFTSWFGPTRYIVKGSIQDYYLSGSVQATLGEPTENEKSSNGGWKQCFKNGCIVGSSSTGYKIIRGSIADYYWSKFNGSRNSLGLPLEEITAFNGNAWMQKFQNGYVIGSYGTGYWWVANKPANAYMSKNYVDSLGLPTQDAANSGNGSKQCFENGCLVGADSTGYWMVRGSIGNYYVANGGAAGNFKLPTSDIESDGTGAYYQNFQGGYVVGRSATGYWGVKGSIGKAYEPTTDLATLGVPIGSETSLGGGVWRQCYENGCIVGSYSTGYWKSSGQTYSYWLNSGGPSGRLGLPTESLSKSSGVDHQKYQGGIIVGSSSTGYWSVKGSIFPAYENVGAFNGTLGLPVANEQSSNGVWSQKFENGYIVGRNGKYFESSGEIRDYWVELGSETSKMGMPIGPVKGSDPGMRWQYYERGVLVMNPKNREVWESRGSLRKVWASLGYQNGRLGYPAGPEVYSDGIWSQLYENGKIETKNGSLLRVTYNP